MQPQSKLASVFLVAPEIQEVTKKKKDTKIFPQPTFFYYFTHHNRQAWHQVKKKKKKTPEVNFISSK